MGLHLKSNCTTNSFLNNRCFLLDLSFIGWILLSILTCGILFIYVVPYMQAARAEFYRTLKGENEPKADEPIIEIPH